jgi:hypothetical protein
MRRAVTRTLVGAALVWGLAGCATPPAPKPADNRFYKQTDVRRCLDLEKERRVTESQACWTDLVRALDTQPDFAGRAELTEADQLRIRQRAGQAERRAGELGRELDRCLNQTARDRAARRACLETYLSQHGAKLTRTERYEIEQAIASQERAAALERGEVEATLEHAGKLLGARLAAEEEGLRVDGLAPDGPLAQAGCPAQGLVVELDGHAFESLDAAERIARLEACEERPVELLIRHGDLEQVRFLRIEARCGSQPGGRALLERRLPAETCSQPGSPELRLGLAWCLDGPAGVLTVWEVCTGSPAEAAGLKPGLRLTRLNGARLLGLGLEDLAGLLGAFPDAPVQFEAEGGLLLTPAPLIGPAFPPDRIERCWRAIEAREEQPEGPTADRPESP